MSLSKTISRMLHKLAMALAIALGGAAAQGQALNISDAPLFLNGSVAPLNMLVLGRDHKLYYEAYADHSDLDGDGTLDIGYKGYETDADGKFKIDYYGYFDSKKCYSYSSNYFTPISTTADKKCPGNWSGDFLNYLTTSRMDALRKVLYGGLRSTDNRSTDSPAYQTILERSLIPQDAHSWGKEYTSTAVDRYDIHDYTPYNVPASGSRHLFANTTLMTSADWTGNVPSTNPPLLRVAQNQPYRIWEWVSIESPVAGTKALDGFSTTAGVNISGISNFNVRVEVCKTDLLETNCKEYPNGNYKPTGLLQDFGEKDEMLFGLLTGSYALSKSGGVIRKNMGTIKDEINVDTDGRFKNVDGIIRTMNRLRVAGYDRYRTSGDTYGVRYPSTVTGAVVNRAFNEGEMGGNWGNPVAEMMYEALRYFAGKGAPTGPFNYTSGIDTLSPLSLPKVASWADPYEATKPFCAKPFMTVMSDVNVSYDSDQLPGSTFPPVPPAIAVTDGVASPALDVTTLGNTIWTNEMGGSAKYFIGESKSAVIANGEKKKDGAPSAKTVTSFSDIRGLSPEEPTKEGSYYAASVAYYGLTNDINARTGGQKPQTFAVALASPLPRIDIPVSTATGIKNISLVPFAKTVKGLTGCNTVNDITPSGFQGTNQIVDFYVESLDDTSGTFQVNFEDVESGNDHDMDAIARYTYTVNADGTVKIRVSSDYAAGCYVQHIGYVISGTNADGTYLEVRDKDTSSANDAQYFLDTPNGFTGTPPAPDSGPGTWNDGTGLGTLQAVTNNVYHERTFTPGPTPGAGLLKDPLWYAAKWGGFTDSNTNNRPDLASEWDEDGNGDPDNYFLVTNALHLKDKLGNAFKEIVRRTGSASSASVNAGSISSETRVYQAKFNSGDWTGQLLSFPVNADGSLAGSEWDAATAMPAAAARHIITTDSNDPAAVGVPFTWLGIGVARQGELANGDGATVGSNRLDFLRGDPSTEIQNGGSFRNRVSRLGDIVSSSPMFVGKPPFFYPDDLESEPYSEFVSANADRRKMVYAGANDGMLHGFDAGSGAEAFAFIPGAVFGNLHYLSDPSYTHRFYVDGTPTIGDAFYSGAWHTILVGGLNKGGKSIYALDVTDPGNFDDEANAGDIFRWEYTDTDLGYTYSRPAIVRMHNGKWAAVFGNGYNNSGDGHAYLYVVDIETGTEIAKIDTGAGSDTTPNGLATPAVVDINGDSIADYVYAGDLLGNMWKFNLTNADDSNWAVAYTDTSVSPAVPKPLYVALDSSSVRQPITSKPEVGRGPRGQGMMIYFGTGKYMELGDKAPTQTQTFYGVHDPNTSGTTDPMSGRGTVDTAVHHLAADRHGGHEERPGSCHDGESHEQSWLVPGPAVAAISSRHVPGRNAGLGFHPAQWPDHLHHAGT